MATKSIYGVSTTIKGFADSEAGRMTVHVIVYVLATSETKARIMAADYCQDRYKITPRWMEVEVMPDAVLSSETFRLER